MSLKQLFCLWSLCLLASGLFSNSAQAQRDQPHSVISVGLTGSPDFLATLGVLNAYSNKTSANVIGFTAGIEAQYRPSQWWSVGLGVRYAALGDNVNDGLVVNNNQGVTSLNSNVSLNATFIEIPVRAKGYFFVTPFVSIYGTLGVSPGILMGTKVNTHLEGVGVSEPVNGPTPDSPLALNVLGGVGAEIRASHRFFLTLQPEYRYYVLSPFKHDGRANLMHALGLQLGFHVAIK